MTSDPLLLQPADLEKAGRALSAPFQLRMVLSRAAPDLAAGSPGEWLTVHCRHILRLLPGRRVVAEAEVGGRIRLMKLFLGRGAAGYRAREARGCAELAAAGVATPALLGELEDPDAGAHALLFEHLTGAAPVPARDAAAFTAAAGELARLHQAGCRHLDLHLDNFLVRPGEPRVFVVDGDRVRRAKASAIGERRSLDDLAILCAQRPPILDEALRDVLRAYAARRGWRDPGSGARLAVLAAATRLQRRRRVQRYLDKAERDCTEFHRQASWRRWVAAVREDWDDALADFAAEPEAALRGARVLKAGNSATVVRVRLGGRDRVVKRYNVKSPWHALRRSFAPVPRFRLAWLNGQRLHFLEIPTARPVMLVERRFGPLKLGAYLVMEDLGELDLAREIAAAGLSGSILAQVAMLFRALEAAELRHGDTKASNFLIAKGELRLVDLDAMRLAPGRHKDVERFLENFDDQPAVRERFAGVLKGMRTGGFAASHPPL